MQVFKILADYFARFLCHFARMELAEVQGLRGHEFNSQIPYALSGRR